MIKKQLMGMAAVCFGALAMADDDVAANAFLRENLRAIGDEVAAYRPALVAMTGDAGIAGEARATLARIDAMMKESGLLARQTRLPEAIKQGEAAKRLAIEAMVRLKSGQTVTHSLKFETPADEYAYELRRFDSNEMLVAMNLREAGANADTGQRQRLAGELDEAQRLKQAAGNDAAAGRYGDAIKRMEAASVHLTRALQALGVPVF
ncbi:MAG TPA: hypothetical protein VFY24_10235 [Azospira sp.]|nr:hypothetical protein [Azospira sp.]